ncbi:hypothetical protein R1flu_007934 [Riccia fluitans]|uniref:Uncharacterized protein n=1 Tax=Riccia fluitans TaxID=41844 RepID=A0ABD1Z086_9MARC
MADVEHGDSSNVMDSQEACQTAGRITGQAAGDNEYRISQPVFSPVPSQDSSGVVNLDVMREFLLLGALMLQQSMWEMCEFLLDPIGFRVH